MRSSVFLAEFRSVLWRETNPLPLTVEPVVGGTCNWFRSSAVYRFDTDVRVRNTLVSEDLKAAPGTAYVH